MSDWDYTEAQRQLTKNKRDIRDLMTENGRLLSQVTTLQYRIRQLETAGEVFYRTVHPEVDSQAAHDAAARDAAARDAAALAEVERRRNELSWAQR